MESHTHKWTECIYHHWRRLLHWNFSLKTENLKERNKHEATFPVQPYVKVNKNVNFWAKALLTKGIAGHVNLNGIIDSDKHHRKVTKLLFESLVENEVFTLCEVITPCIITSPEGCDAISTEGTVCHRLYPVINLSITIRYLMSPEVSPKVM